MIGICFSLPAVGLGMSFAVNVCFFEQRKHAARHSTRSFCAGVAQQLAMRPSSFHRPQGTERDDISRLFFKLSWTDEFSLACSPLLLTQFHRDASLCL